MISIPSKRIWQAKFASPGHSRRWARNKMEKGIVKHNFPLLSSMICIANPTIHYPTHKKRTKKITNVHLKFPNIAQPNQIFKRRKKKDSEMSQTSYIYKNIALNWKQTCFNYNSKWSKYTSWSLGYYLLWSPKT